MQTWKFLTSLQDGQEAVKLFGMLHTEIPYMKVTVILTKSYLLDEHGFMYVYKDHNNVTMPLENQRTPEEILYNESQIRIRNPIERQGMSVYKSSRQYDVPETLSNPSPCFSMTRDHFKKQKKKRTLHQ